MIVENITWQDIDDKFKEDIFNGQDLLYKVCLNKPKIAIDFLRRYKYYYNNNNYMLGGSPFIDSNPYDIDFDLCKDLMLQGLQRNKEKNKPKPRFYKLKNLFEKIKNTILKYKKITVAAMISIGPVLYVLYVLISWSNTILEFINNFIK